MELLIFVILLTLIAAQESQLNGPQNTLSVVGSNVTLKCSSPSKNCNNTEWLKYGGNPVTVFNDREIISNAYRDRYSVDNSSGCDLAIKNVQIADAGRFICRSFVSSQTVEGPAYFIIMKNNLTCATNASLSDTVDRDGVKLTCEVTFNGTNTASIVWEGVTDAPDAVKTGNTIRRFYSVAASASGVPSFTCNTSFVVETKDSDGRLIVGLATNIPSVTCETPAIKVKYSVRDVQLSPSISTLPPGSTITCTANGDPSPTFKWQKMENCGTWVDISNKNSSEFSMNEASSTRYRCVAMNVVRGRSYDAFSMEFQVNNSEFNEKLSSTNTSVPGEHFGFGIGIGVGIGFFIAIFLATIAFAVLVKLRYFEFHSRPVNKPAGNVDHEMRTSSCNQQSAMNPSISRTKAPLVGEQDSEYASLGEKGDANEYAALEIRQKAKPRKTSRP